MNGPRFSLIIPTRERASTLKYTIAACLMQDYRDYEIVVCDNCSSPETKAVVDSFASPQIVYHRSPTPLSMGENWNLAYSKSSGQYVTYIGDDDALMPHAFSALDSFLKHYPARAMRWNCAVYSWPNIARADFADYLALSLQHGYRPIDGRQAIKDVLAGREPATILPNIYHGCASRAVLEDIRTRGGQVFASFYCDTYSSFAIAHASGEYVSLDAPLSISGFSASSNNIAFNFMRGKNEKAKIYKHENALGGLRVHPIVPDIHTDFVPVADSFLTAKDTLFPDDDDLTLDRRAMISRFLATPPIDTLDDWPPVVAELRRSVSDDPELLRWFEDQVRDFTPVAQIRKDFKAPFEAVYEDSMHLFPSRYGVTDVEGATKLAARLLGYRGDAAISNESAGAFARKIALLRRKLLLKWLHYRAGTGAAPLSSSQPA